MFRLFLECVPFVDLALVLDSSSSIGETEWFELLEFTKSFLRSLNFASNQFNVAVLTYADDVIVRSDFNSFENVAQFVESMSFTYSRGGTDAASMLKYEIYHINFQDIEENSIHFRFQYFTKPSVYKRSRKSRWRNENRSCLQ